MRNYRPISILNVMAIILGSFVADALKDSFKGILVVEQHGFSQGRSTITNLLLYRQYITKAMKESSQVDAIYTDFTKAFDRVNHVALLTKLKSYGVKGNLYKWSNGYLVSRSHYVRMRGFNSNSFISSSGVPQGSHLGPILFNIFMNDMIHVLTWARFLLYADDLKLFIDIRSGTDAQMLQEYLNNIVVW